MNGKKEKQEKYQKQQHYDDMQEYVSRKAKEQFTRPAYGYHSCKSKKNIS